MSHEQNDQQAQMLRGLPGWQPTTLSTVCWSRLYSSLVYLDGKIWSTNQWPFTMGYNIYAWFLLISTAGVPVAVAKQIPNTIPGQADHSFALIRVSWNMGILGLVCHSHVPVVSCLCEPFRWRKSWFRSCRVFSWAVWSFLRWVLFADFSKVLTTWNLTPLARSPEQVIRVIWMLLRPSSLWRLAQEIMCRLLRSRPLLPLSVWERAFWCSFITLQKTGLLSSILRKQEGSEELTLGLSWSIRFVRPFLLSSLVPPFSSFKLSTRWPLSCHVLVLDYSQKQLLVMFSYFSANPNKITMILIAVATSIGGVGSSVDRNYVKGDLKAAGKLVQDNLTMLLVSCFQPPLVQ